MIITFSTYIYSDYLNLWDQWITWSVRHILPSWTLTILILMIALDLYTTGHLLLNKRDAKSAVTWILLIWLSPLLGPLLYYIFGINRIERQAKILKGIHPSLLNQYNQFILETEESHHQSIINQIPPQYQQTFSYINKIISSITHTPLSAQNTVLPLLNGEETYPLMLESINQANKSIALSTYIFDRDKIGKKFVEALAAAVKRGVEVRVLIDDMGIKYSFPTITTSLRKSNIPYARFNPTFAPWKISFLNLRNHRKILVIDGEKGFTGGINIRQGHMVHDPQVKYQSKILDLHFYLEGPIVTQLQKIFSQDWKFTTREALNGKMWFPPFTKSQGNVLARGIPDGPDLDFEKILWALLGAIHAAKKSIKILCPYFLPDLQLITALNIASLSGVKVEIVLPEKSNLIFVHWAMMGTIDQLLEKGCHIYLSPPPFDHSKLMIVDDFWCFFGSSNWDARSLRLNFEFNVECYDEPLAFKLNQLIEGRIALSKNLTIEILKERNLFQKLRDGLFKLFSPYL